MSEQQEEPEVSDELRELKDLSQEIQTHKTRVGNLKSEGKLGGVLSEELSDTVMSLFADFAEKTLRHSAMTEDWLHSLEEDIEEGGGGDVEPDLSDEEIETFKFLLARLREFVMGTKAAPGVTSEITQAMLQIELKLSEGEKVLERLSEEDGESEEETEEEREESEGDASGGGA